MAAVGEAEKLRVNVYGAAEGCVNGIYVEAPKQPYKRHFLKEGEGASSRAALYYGVDLPGRPAGWYVDDPSGRSVYCNMDKNEKRVPFQDWKVYRGTHARSDVRSPPPLLQVVGSLLAPLPPLAAAPAAGAPPPAAPPAPPPPGAAAASPAAAPAAGQATPKAPSLVAAPPAATPAASAAVPAAAAGAAAAAEGVLEASALQSRVFDAALEDGLDRSPIAGLFPHELPVKPLEECIRQVSDELPANMPLLVRKARRKASDVEDRYPDLTEDERTMCTLYTMETHPREQSLYFVMNVALRDKERKHVRKWRDTVWLLLNALKKLPQPTEGLLFRGTPKAAADLGKQCIQGKEFVWSAFSSTTTRIDGMAAFLGTDGDRVQWTLKMLPGYMGRDLVDFSFFDSEHEVLLAPNLEFKVIAVLNCGHGLTQVQCEQIEATDPLIF